ncbi:MAG: hypothetical protein JW750_10900 [Anaerolineaceae bacterium]|nr:hypothetical protein [Anaerolineaceae bacterium]
MGAKENEVKWRVLAVEKLIEEAKPNLVGEPRIWMRTFGSAVSQAEVMGEIFKSKIPLGSGRFRTDRRVFVDLPFADGVLHVVQNYAGGVPLPQDFMMEIADARIPHAVSLMPNGIYDKWQYPDQPKKEKDPFCTHLDNIKEEGFLGAPKFADKSEYNVQLAPKTNVKVDWTMQVVPLRDETVLFMFKRKIYRNMWNGKPDQCNVDEFMALRELMKNSIMEFNYDGPAPALSVPTPTISFLSIPEFAGLIPDKGVEVPWEG